MPILLKPGNPQNLFQVIPIIVSVLAFFPFTGTDTIALFTDADRMRLDAGQIFYILDAKPVHVCWLTRVHAVGAV